MSAPKNSRERVRARKARLAIRSQDLVDRMQSYALGELDEESEMTRGELDAAKFLLNLAVPAYQEPRPVFENGTAKGSPGGNTFILSWGGGQDPTLLLAEQDRTLEALPSPLAALPPDPVLP